MNMKKFLFLFLLLTALTASCLEIDEKLTSRVLRVSSSKKTMLINRGLEDGLVVGDHAKFFITTGVVARGIVIKASPTRTIWALYRLVDPEEVKVDSVIDLKIAAPVKLTNDSSRTFGRDQVIGNSPYYSVGDEISLRNRAQGIPVDQSRSELASMYDSDDLDIESRDAGIDQRRMPQVKNDGGAKSELSMPQSGAGVNYKRNIEIFALMMLDMENTTSSTDEFESTSSTTSYEGYIGGELYFTNQQSWYKNFSLLAFIHPGSSSTTESTDSGEDYTTSGSLMELGLGVNYHFGADPFAYHKLIGYGGLKFGYGSVSSTAGDEEEDNSGTCSSYSFGLGGKYYFENGIGLQLLVEYLTRTASYTYEDSDSDRTDQISDISIWAGLSYRF